jgi:flagellar protein FlbD
MISLTRFHSGECIAVNPDLIERMEESPDTVVTMTNGNRYVIGETIDEITDKIRVFRASLLALAMQMADHPAIAGTARLTVIRGQGGADGPGTAPTAPPVRAGGAAHPGRYESGGVEP